MSDPDPFRIDGRIQDPVFALTDRFSRAMDRQFPVWALLVDPPEIPEGPFFSAWISRGRHAGMGYLARTAGRRLSLQAGYPGYRSIAMALLPYRSEAFSGHAGPGQAQIARYAVGEDYHARFEKGFAGVLSMVGDLLPADEHPLVKPDHGSLLEKSLAQMAGLGVMGKNTLLINELYGSAFTIGCLLLKTPLSALRAPYGTGDPCGSCTRCLSECPTGAFPGPYDLDAVRCLSYLTIERPDDPMKELRREKGARWLFGCDRCQEVCPHNAGWRQGEAGPADPGGRLVSLSGLSDKDLVDLRRRHTALSRVSTKTMAERIAEIAAWESGEE